MYEIPRDRLYIEDLRPGDKFRVVALREGGDPTWSHDPNGFYRDELTLGHVSNDYRGYGFSMYHFYVEGRGHYTFAEGAEVELV